MTIQTPDTSHETQSFKIADQEICAMLKHLHDVCPCCTARALAFHAECLAGLKRLSTSPACNHSSAPDPMPSTEVH